MKWVDVRVGDVLWQPVNPDTYGVVRHGVYLIVQLSRYEDTVNYVYLDLVLSRRSVECTVLASAPLTFEVLR